MNCVFDLLLALLLLMLLFFPLLLLFILVLIVGEEIEVEDVFCDAFDDWNRIVDVEEILLPASVAVVDLVGC